ncbi:MAG TPA: penicillin-binding transpeptidase domain-containing protein [Bacillota bacterium]|nr:penicillin-binding transpeptidase domain-containing protein [Bacillota bacterium]
MENESKIIKIQPNVNNGNESSEEPSQGLRIGGHTTIVIISAILFIFMGCLIYKLYDISVNKYLEYSMEASQIHWKRIVDVPVRGDIYDANMNLLASTTYEYTIGITPNDLLKSQDIPYTSTDPTDVNTTRLACENIASQFSELINADYETVLDALYMVDATYVQLIKRVSYTDMIALRAYLSEKNMSGVAIDNIPKRYYTYSNLAPQVIGFADQSSNTLVGQYGIEAYYDDILTGTYGYTYAEVDNASDPLPFSSPTSVEAEDGYNVVLNIDMNIQRIAEDACREAYDTYQPRDGVTAIVMNPYTGAIMAMVSMPDFDLNNARSCPYGITEMLWNTYTDEEKAEYLMSNAWRNRCISDTYEPGSTFKALTTAIAFEEGLTYEDELFSDAPIEVSEIDTISCWREKTHGNHGTETLTQAFDNSCNPIFVQLAYRIGITKYYEYVHNFGFYDVTGIDLPAEGMGIFHEEPTVIDLATLSFGESSTVTPMQLAMVYSALVNGGTLMTPRVASAITDSDGNIVRSYDPVAVKTIFSEQTCERVQAMLESVVTEGTGSAGYVEGYYVAGKTSTSTIEVGDEEGMHVLSFGCYAPSYDPEIVVLVVINKPEDKTVGSSAAASTAATIVENSLEYLGIDRRFTQEDYDAMTTKFYLQDVVGLTFDEAKTKLTAQGFTVVDGSNSMTGASIVGMMYPGIHDTLYRSGVVILYPMAISNAEMPQVEVPDFTGMTLIECIRLAQENNLNISVTGDPTGVAVSQDPARGYEETADPDTPQTEGGDEDGVTPQATDPGGEENTPGMTPTPTPTPTPSSGPQMVQVPMGTIIKITME